MCRHAYNQSQCVTMGRFFCDYCDTYLTHDSVRRSCWTCTTPALFSPSFLVVVVQAKGRKQHNYGWKHRENFRLFYQQVRCLPWLALWLTR